MSCNVAQAVAAFGRYISFKLFDNIKQIILDRVTIAAVVDLMKFFEKRKKTSEKKNRKKKPPSLIHFFFYKISLRT
jgi:hypothetical protein